MDFELAKRKFPNEVENNINIPIGSKFGQPKSNQKSCENLMTKIAFLLKEAQFYSKRPWIKEIGRVGKRDPNLVYKVTGDTTNISNPLELKQESRTKKPKYSRVQPFFRVMRSLNQVSGAGEHSFKNKEKYHHETQRSNNSVENDENKKTPITLNSWEEPESITSTQPIETQTKLLKLVFNEITNFLKEEIIKDAEDDEDDEEMKIKKNSLISNRWGKRSNNLIFSETKQEKQVLPKRSVVGLNQWGRK
ncbi:uncharacterized protein LOC111709545 isoform X4 [Eurytemora carolleeae]|uniref:uncharacterized protein LOC111709545 isoform X4 n=1 Tax=Eurytemora carolleeae TaxID=1294199 RepID=UPI000C7786E8|nr:uncharacterized protein LOC111709545 isoform X4 [Eurytemora carolleeae]|eukprot:XP_023339022.1 uncharacterized protein LOC111709545 isoform X4 [Eurytemora affinis]